MAEADKPSFSFLDLLPPASDPAVEIRAGILAPEASISPKFFYDALGCKLFEAICELPEYTLPRAEAAILRRHALAIADKVGRRGTLIDLGAGNCAKAERLFATLQPRQYVAVDIAADYLHVQLEALARRHPDIDIVGLASDFSDGLSLPPGIADARCTVFYPGSSIGNFGTAEAIGLLRTLHRACAGDHLVLGADLIRAPAAMVAAYDDALGVTAAFNLNVLCVVNRLAGTDFNPADWRHVALYNAAERRIEMHVEARWHAVVKWPTGMRGFMPGERIHTENSYKYTPESLAALLREAGFVQIDTLTDDAREFAVAVARERRRIPSAAREPYRRVRVRDSPGGTSCGTKAVPGARPRDDAFST